MKTRLSIPIETIFMLPTDREYSEAEAIIQVVYDIETSAEWSVLGYSKQFGWSRTKVENFLEKKTKNTAYKEKLKKHREISNSKGYKPLKDRKHTFGLSLVCYVEQYGKEMIREFFNYWTESGNGKMRFEGQEYFDIPRRLSTWSQRLKEAPTGGSIEKAKRLYDWVMKQESVRASVDRHVEMRRIINASKWPDDVKKLALDMVG